VGSNLDEAIKIHSTPSFGSEVKPQAPCHKILWHIEELYRYERNTLYTKSNIAFTGNLLICY
jgi:hypothetical protein